ILITNRQGTEVLGRVQHQGKLSQLAWSPDGQHLAILGGTNKHDPAPNRLFVVPNTGGNAVQLRPYYKGAFDQIQWIDSTSIAFLASTGAWSTYGAISMNGSKIDTLISAGKTILQEFSRAQNGTTVFWADRPIHRRELYVAKDQNSSPKRLTYSNPWLKNTPLGKQQVVSWRGKDSLKLQGILIYPTNYQQDQQYPLI